MLLAIHQAHFFGDSLVCTHVPETSYLVTPAETIGFVRLCISRATSRQSCCVLNSKVVTVPDAAPVVANGSAAALAGSVRLCIHQSPIHGDRC
jgi:hypothetical protein